jgi:hypothetical protein
MSCEPALRQYFAQFDGTKKDFSTEAEHLFDNLVHEKFTLTLTDGTAVSRDAVKEMHADQLSKGTIVTLVHFRKIGFECVDAKFAVQNDREGIYKITHLIYSIEDNKLASSQEVDDSSELTSFLSTLRARCASDWKLYNVMGKYGTNM